MTKSHVTCNHSAPKLVLPLLLLLGLSSLLPSVVAGATAGSCADQTSCAACLSATPSSPGVVSCTWFEDLSYCEEGCGMDGCGASVCAADVSTCEDCLGLDTAAGQYSWVPATTACVPDANCNDGLVPADSACFGGASYDAAVCSETDAFGQPIVDVVEIAVQPGGCNAATTCSECMAATPDPDSSDVPFCTWFEDVGFCQEGCGSEEGCGAIRCPDTITSCYQCLASDAPSFSQWSWVPDAGGPNGTCVTSCSSLDVPADAPCFSGTEHGTDACPKCSDHTTCADCLAHYCSYAEDGNCYDTCSDPEVPADGACFDGKVAGNTPDEVCPALELECSGTSRCDVCLGMGCSYSPEGGGCYDDCSDPMVLADGTCFDGTVYDSMDVCPTDPMPPPPPPEPIDWDDGMGDGTAPTNSTSHMVLYWTILFVTVGVVSSILV